MIQTEAREACREKYTDLVTVYSDEDNTELTELVMKAGMGSGWIGLYRGQFSEKWSNGDPVTFRNLTGDCGTSDCCTAMKADGSWESLPCTVIRYFMCYEQEASSQTPNYHVILENKTWYEAQRYCRQKYTDLVSIRDQQHNEEVKIKGLNSTTPFWIGLLRDDWQWTDGGNSAYRNWGNSGPGDCVRLMEDGRWHSVPCSNKHSALCYNTFIHVSDMALSWEKALDYCQEEKRGGLLQIESEDDQSDVVKELKREAYQRPCVDNTELAELVMKAGMGSGWIGLYRGIQIRDQFFDRLFICLFVCLFIYLFIYLFLTSTEASSQTPNYHLILENKTWYEAQRYCRQNYTDLVSIRDQQHNEEVKIKGLNSTTPFWIGLLRDDWQWTDGGNSAYRNWGNNGSGDCVRLMEDGRWHPVPVQ
ncbi:hypothetical protein QTP70_032886 [Hemibagrus guttatus]|uniref:C-type lectin domain-containing protein n=1 Tax=Hemibagrus guttatus TaxID=175788 RepID=A0AAE0Q524_9TELE|nr:hypothetical protein QTP70_032886 [Hemibagrus guttatus]